MKPPANGKPAMLLEMLEYMRPEGSLAQKEFCERFLEPLMGKPDAHGNYILIIGDKPKVAFMAHHDTVHREGGKQKLEITLDNVVFSDANCLGADCTTGVWLITEMIQAGIEGVYVVHAGEEKGCIGSSALVKERPAWIKHVDAAISFDRKGTSSIITHQMGMRTASEAFSKSLEGILKLGLKSDDGGSYTDSNEYAYVVSECTNISVGYYNQHTKSEYQDLDFAYQLRDALIQADWSQLECKRVPSTLEYADYYGNTSSSYSRRFFSDSFWQPVRTGPMGDLVDVIEEYPEAVALLLSQLGYDAYDILDVVQEQERESTTDYGDFRNVTDLRNGTTGD